MPARSTSQAHQAFTVQGCEGVVLVPLKVSVRLCLGLGWRWCLRWLRPDWFLLGLTLAGMEGLRARRSDELFSITPVYLPYFLCKVQRQVARYCVVWFTV